MKLTKLLTGAAVATLMTAGAASAQVTIDSVTFGTGAGAVSAANQTFWLASELNVQNAARTVTLAFALDDSTPANGSSGWATGAAQLRIDFTGFLLNQSVVPGDLVCTGGAATTIASGGAPGDNFVVFNIADINACANGGTSDAELVASGLDLLYNGTSGGNYTVTLTNTATGNPVDGPAVSHTGATVSSVNRGLVATRSIADVGRTGAAGVWRANLNSYSTLTNTTGAAVDAAAVASTYVDFASNAAGAVTYDYTMTVPNATGLNLSAFRIGATAPTVTGNTLEFDNISGAAQAITVAAATGANAAAISEQTLSGTVDVNFTNSLLADFSAPVTYGSIVRQGGNSTTFEWVGDADATNFSVFRMTGFDPEAPLPAIRAVLSNASADDALNGEYVLDTSGLTLTAGGELVMSSRQLGQQIGAFDRADVRFFFESGRSINVRRFIASADGTLSTFDGDFDQSCGSATVTATTGGDFNGSATATRAAFTCTQ